MKKEVIVIIVVCIVVAIITAFVTTNLTGNVVSVGWWNKHQVYTVEEVDKLIEDLNTGDNSDYYTKEEIDNLLKDLDKGETTVVSNNDTYTKEEIDNLINSIGGDVTYQGVLDLFANNCETEGTSMGSYSCSDECQNVVGKNCIFGQVISQYNMLLNETKGMIVSCDVKVDDLKLGFGEDAALMCLCCST